MFQVSLQKSAGTQAGRVELLTLLVEFAGDFRCDPLGILTLPQVRELCRQLRSLPQVASGRIGVYDWALVTPSTWASSREV